jgi:hypothetical protein
MIWGVMCMTNEIIKSKVLEIVDSYPIKKISLFGSRADGTNRAVSDVDLIIEFTEPISILTLSQIKCELEESIGLAVDVIHKPIREDNIDITQLLCIILV